MSSSQPPSPQPPPPPNKRGWADYATLWAAALVVLVPVGLVWPKMEIAAWHGAAAQQASWDGNFPKAVEQFDRALEWDRDEPNYLALRAEAYFELGRREEAVRDVQRAIELAPQDDKLFDLCTDLMARAGKAEMAARLWQSKHEQFLRSQDSGKDPAKFHNSIAYNLAIANKDLDVALDHADRAVGTHKPYNAGAVDTRAYVYYRLGRYADGLRDMNSVIPLMAKEQPQLETLVRSTCVDDRHFRRQMHESRRTLAVMYYHRALIHQAIGETMDGQEVAGAIIDGKEHDVSAAIDRYLVRELGFKPDDSLF